MARYLKTKSAMVRGVNSRPTGKRPPNPLRVDPTRTGGLVRVMTSHINKQFARLTAAIRQKIEVEDALGLKASTGPALINAMVVLNDVPWKFGTDPQKLRQFQDWLRHQAEATLTTVDERQLWDKFVHDGFQQGAKRSYDDYRGKRKLHETLDFYHGTREEFLKTAFAQPVAIEKVELIAERTFNEIQGVSDTMKTRMGRVLAEGLTRGESPRTMAAGLIEEGEIGKKRALTIARTEVIRAHAQGQLIALKKMGVEELGVATEWSTTGDEKVCELCEPLQGIVLTLDEAEGLIPRHPNCRCAWIPAVDEEEDMKRKKSEIDDALEESGLESVDISPKRPKLG